VAVAEAEARPRLPPQVILSCGYFRSDFVGTLSSAVLIVASSGF